MNKQLIGWILKAPLLLVFVAAFLISLYLAIKHLQGITYITPVIFGIGLVLYSLGEYFSRTKIQYDNG